MERWKGKIALVTGASAGIGANICRELVKYGMIVIGCARRLNRIKDIAEEESIKISAGKLIPMKCDLTNEAEIVGIFDEICNKFGRLDVCINNAGICLSSPLLTGNTIDWQNMQNVNVLALCICNREAVKLMLLKEVEEGQIINISSMVAHQASRTPGLQFYTGTKLMVRTLTEGLRRELKSQSSRIRVGSISPGLVETELLDRIFQNDLNSNRSNLYDTMECLQPKNIADAVVYILESPPHVEVNDILIRSWDQTI